MVFLVFLLNYKYIDIIFVLQMGNTNYPSYYETDCTHELKSKKSIQDSFKTEIIKKTFYRDHTIIFTYSLNDEVKCEIKFEYGGPVINTTITIPKLNVVNYYKLCYCTLVGEGSVYMNFIINSVIRRAVWCEECEGKASPVSLPLHIKPYMEINNIANLPFSETFVKQIMEKGAGEFTSNNNILYIKQFGSYMYISYRDNKLDFYEGMFSVQGNSLVSQKECISTLLQKFFKREKLYPMCDKINTHLYT